MLRPHIVGLGGFDRAPRPNQTGETVRIVGVDVNLQQLLRRRDDDRAAQFPQPGAQLGPGRPPPAADQHLDAVAVVPFGRHAGLGCGVGNRRRRAHGRGRHRIPLDEAHDPLDGANEGLRPGVHHAGFAKDREQLGRPAQRRPAARQDVAHQFAQVGRTAGRVLGCLGRLARDGEDGSFDGFVERSAQLIGALANGPGDVDRPRGVPLAQAATQPHQELRQQHPRVSVGTEERRLGHGPRDLGQGGPVQIPYAFGRRSERRGEIRPRISVGYGKHVDAIELVAGPVDPVRRCEERPPKSRTGEVANGQRAGCHGFTPSRPTPARRHALQGEVGWAPCTRRSS